MFNLIHFWPKPLLGLDIQSEEIRLLQLGTLKKQSIKQAVSQRLPSGAVVEGKIEEPEIVTDCLKELIQAANLQKFAAAIALPAHCATSQHILVAKGLREPELEEEVVNHLRNTMSSMTEGLCYDYAVTTKDEIHNDVLVVATSFANLNSYLSVVQAAGLKVRAVDVDEYALIRANEMIKKRNLHIDKKWLISLGLALRGQLKW